MIQAAYEEEKSITNGVPYPFESHVQTRIGEGVMADAHFHDYIEILFCLNGKIEIFLDGKRYDFYAGDMILINSREVHYILGKAELNQYIVLKFEPEVLYTTSKTIFEAKYVLPFTLNQSTHQKLFPHDEIKDTFIPTLLREIAEEFARQNYGFELAIRTHIGRIFLWILRDWNQKGLDLNINDALNENTIQRLKRVFDYVDKNYGQAISVQDVAKLSNMSYSYFSRFFKAVMKKNFNEYLNFVRITGAEKLLTTTDLTITEIAQSVGFSTSSYFVHQFKNFKHITPKQFRKTLKAV